eukprot:TRINITY_DN23773_c0_g1_i1.p1 TRINITY_DN23773_c0_g1~~TRINITY_DN23773_c0_g1_i1.p1  ORF type:complete len:3127 (+),score=463.32 TRINITY_DN23773_c0_g1_i1:92-9382(+)
MPTSALSSVCRTIREWLMSIDDDLGIYADQFEEFGYTNLNLLRQADEAGLQEDLGEMGVKKHHRRVVLKHFAKLQQEAEPPKAFETCSQDPPPCPELSKCLANACEGSGGTFPLLAEILEFQKKELPDLPAHLGSGRILYLPVWCLRWVQRGVHGQMIFSSGRRKDRSVYELVHDLLAGREQPEQLEPLEVVLDGSQLHSLSNRRLVALMILQAVRRHKAVRVPCQLYAPGDPKVVSRYRLKDTSSELGNGLSVLLHGHQQDAWHLGVPLFSSAQEWCDSVPAISSHVEARRDARSVIPWENRLSLTSTGDAAPPVQAQDPAESGGFASSELTKVAKDEKRGHAIATLQNSSICSTLLEEGPRIPIAGAQTNVQPFVDKETRKEQRNKLSLSWGSQMETTSSISAQDSLNFFDGKQLDITGKAGNAHSVQADVSHGAKVVMKYPKHGYAIVEVDNPCIRDAVLRLGSFITLAGIRMDVRPYAGNRFRKDASKMLFVGWGSKVERLTSVNDEDVVAFFNTKQVEMTGQGEPSSSNGQGNILQKVIEFLKSRGGEAEAGSLGGMFHINSSIKAEGGWRAFVNKHPDSIEMEKGRRGNDVIRLRSVSCLSDSDAATCAHTLAETESLRTPGASLCIDENRAGAQVQSMNTEMGHALVSFESSYIRNAVLQSGPRITVAGVSMQVKPCVRGGKDVSNMLFVGWGRAAQERNRVSKKDLVAYFSRNPCEVNIEEQQTNTPEDAGLLLSVVDFLKSRGGAAEVGCFGVERQLSSNIRAQGGWRALASRHSDVIELERSVWGNTKVKLRCPTSLLHGSQVGERHSDVMSVRDRHDADSCEQIAAVQTSSAVVDISTLQGMTVKVKSGKKFHFAKVLSICHGELPLKVHYFGCTPKLDERVRVEDVLVPDFSGLQEGMEVIVRSENISYKANVVTVSRSQNRRHEPVKVHYHAYSVDADEWVGADRLLSKALQFRPARSPIAVGSKDATSGEPVITFGTDEVLQQRHDQSVDVLEGMIVQVISGGNRDLAEVKRIRHTRTKQSAQKSIKVHYISRTAESDEWVSKDSLLIPDFSGVQRGMKVQVKNGNKQFYAEVVEVSQAQQRLNAPVRVHYQGYDENSDEWIGADRLLSKSLKFTAAMSHSESVNEQQKSGKCELADDFGPPMRSISNASEDNSICAGQESRNISLNPEVYLTSAKQLQSPMPWGAVEVAHQEESDGPLGTAIKAVHNALTIAGVPAHELASKLQEASQSVKVRSILADHAWTGSEFAQLPDLEHLLNQLKSVRSEEDADSDNSSCCSSDWFKEEFAEQLDHDIGSSEEYEAEVLDNELEDQSDVVQQLTGILVRGTFRCVSGTVDKRMANCGEVLVERGPKPLLGCKVRVVGQSNRNRAWDFDRCWVRILLGKLYHPEGPRRTSSPALDEEALERTEIYGQIVRADEFGIPRQRFFVCSKAKIMRRRKEICFKPINGKLPQIRVPRDQQLLLEIDSSDLHVVEVLDWSRGQPQGRYVENLKMHTRTSPASIMKAVQLSLNYNDWPSRVTGMESAASPTPLSPDPLRSERNDVRHLGLAVGIQHNGLPVCILLSSFPSQGPGLQVHVVDVNAYLDRPEFAEIEALARRRAVGSYFMDHLDQSLGVSLPILPSDLEEAWSFCAGSDQPALTLSFSVDEETGNISPCACSVSETLVRCDHILSPSEAGAMILDKAEGGEVGCLLRLLFKHACQFEAHEEARGSFAVLEHLDADFTPSSPEDQSHEGQYGCLVANRLLLSCMQMVSQYAGKCLATRDAWPPLIAGPQNTQIDDCRQSLALCFTRGRPDPSTWKVIERLLRCQPTNRTWQNLKVQDVLKELKRILAQPGLTRVQQHCLQASFMRRLRDAFPYAYYAVFDERTAGFVFQRTAHSSAGDLFHYESTFHVTAPLQRYLDVLGMRALKSHGGWVARCEHMQLSVKELQEAAARTNARQASNRFAQQIFRRISWMTELLHCGRPVNDALIGAVGPSYINVLLPSWTSDVFELKVPVFAVRSPTCFVDYDPADQSLRMKSWNEEMQDYDTWFIKSWCDAKLSCIVSRNFVQPIPHHASSSSIMVSALIFDGLHQVRFDVGHKMYPEVFSSWVELSQWAVLDRDVRVYSAIWSKIRLCQVHAAAACSAAYTHPACIRSLVWRREENTWYFQCLEPGDLAILRCSAAGGEVTLYGLVQNAAMQTAKHQLPSCAAKEEKQFKIQAKLSEISSFARNAQQVFVESAKRFDLQFITVPANEKKSVELLRSIPVSLSLGGLRVTVPKSSQEKNSDMESRPLATKQQVSDALRNPQFGSRNGKTLNEMQIKAVERGLQRPFSLVQGPPGTGKTTFLVRLITALLSLEMDITLRYHRQLHPSQPSQARTEPGRLLVCAPSNHAADEVVQRLVRDTNIPHKFITRVYARSIEKAHGSLYKGRPHLSMRTDLFDIKADLEEHALHYKVSQLYGVQKIVKRADQKAFDKEYELGEVNVLKSSRIVVTTCTNAFLHTALNKGEPPEVTRPINFATVVIDEAAQASEPDVVMPSMLAGSRVVVVGDHKQLGPVVTERNLSSLYVSALEVAFLERVLKTPQLLPTNTMLNEQYRMHPSIRRFPSSQFYDSNQRDSVSIANRPWLGCLWPNEGEHVLFIDNQTPQTFGISLAPGRTKCCDTGSQSDTSLKNVGEARIVSDVCALLLEQGKCSSSDIAVITPYKAQQQEIRAKLSERFNSASSSILVGTVHALQGSEREYIIISFVRSTTANVHDIHSSDDSGIILSSDPQCTALHELCTSNLGILRNSKLLNVALTRAKYGMVCVGNRAVLSNGSKDFLDLTRGLDSRGCVMDRATFLARSRHFNSADRSKTHAWNLRKGSSNSVAPEDSASNLDYFQDARQQDLSAFSEVLSHTSTPSLTSVISASGSGPRCFYEGTILTSSSGLKVPVERLDTGTLVCSATGGQLRVMGVHRYDGRVDLVCLAAGAASHVFTNSHRILMEGEGTKLAKDVRIGDKVLVTGKVPTSVTYIQTYTEECGVYQVTFDPDEPVESFLPPESTILSMGHAAEQRASGRGRGEAGRGGHVRTRRSGMNRRLERQQDTRDVQSIPNTYNSYL